MNLVFRHTYMWNSHSRTLRIHATGEHAHARVHTHTPFIMAPIDTDASASTPRLRLRSIYPAPICFVPHSLAHLHIEEELGAAL